MTSKRVFSCVLCQERKIKCDRNSPCGQCIKANVQCVSFASRQRRRRFPERELLERISRYEGLLKENDISFDPLHSSTPTVRKSEDENTNSAPSTSMKLDNRDGTIYAAK